MFKNITKQNALLLCITAMASIVITFLVMMFIGKGVVLNYIATGALEGYSLKGTYAVGTEIDNSIYFETKEDSRIVTWGARTPDTDYVTGTAEQTDDPNIYVLLDEKGSFYALAHLAYERNNTGKLFVSYDGKNFEPYEKISNIRVTYTAEP
ncbi:hypothetical protein HMPREF1248_0524 [Coriobacteriaceae bacterium BV3Ac1]|uniref:hypothetical protein n=2 Tax=Olegusella massiliensis TaxID=1776381 RepID=UPI0003AD8072|nr:hypothetical protein [Olegusella massiliensis]ERL11678.1 hypothetical protein HMPREF1248_0524 [Coriobacteriaceae bacterium BV3Ac1]